jgi:hypothetical protein
MEANNSVTGTVTLQAMPVLNTNAPAGYDSVKINGITFGFTPYTPQTEYIAPMPIPEKNWKENGVGIRRNGDYDNGSTTVRDWAISNPITEEDDLIRTDIDITSVSGISYVLKKSSTDVAMWASSQKGGSQYVVSATGTTITSGGTLWAEYTNFGEDICTLTLAVIDTTSGNELFTEELVYRPFNSVTAAFVGENQQAGDPIYSPGVNDWVIQELLNGYDVHVFDDGYDVFSTITDCNTFGEGNALNEIANAINNRGVDKVAILGYSHGGGSVYHLSQALAYDGEEFTYVAGTGSTGEDIYASKYYSDKIQNSYSVVFTSYIDAISNEASAVMASERRRPINSLYHVNQYQKNTYYLGVLGLNGDESIAVGDIDEDRSDWFDKNGTELTHSTIDDDEAILTVIRNSFEGRVER